MKSKLPKSVYFLGIAGMGMGALALALRRHGVWVRGCDRNVYPPMSDELASAGIDVDVYDDLNALIQMKPDCVVCGNVIRSQHIMAQYCIEHEWPMYSMAEALAMWAIGDKHSIVVAGTHGKTTTTALLRHVLMTLGEHPSGFVGGVLRDGSPGLVLDTGQDFVVEGDEYDTAFFDKRPKFIHYRAQTVVLTSIEFDHADIFADLSAVRAAFALLIEGLPSRARIVAYADSEEVVNRVRPRLSDCDVLWYGAGIAVPSSLTAENACFFKTHDVEEDGSWVVPLYQRKEFSPVKIPFWGEKLIANTAAVWGTLVMRGHEPERVLSGIASFPGVKKRLESRQLAENIWVIEDFAHHPTAVAATLAALRGRFQSRRLWAIFEPRSATCRRRVHEQDLITALSGADVIVLATHARLSEIEESERFRPATVVERLKHLGKQADYVASSEHLLEHVHRGVVPGDVLVWMSNGDFDHTAEKFSVAWSMKHNSV
jgi:UDP-N-acetylmuramate: L-alanyl-gamma-D-glutamyl-meso-diaminopimelate ligase